MACQVGIPKNIDFLHRSLFFPAKFSLSLAPHPPRLSLSLPRSMPKNIIWRRLDRSVRYCLSSTSVTIVHVVAGCDGLLLHVGSTRQLCFVGASGPKVGPGLEAEAVNNS